jgi:hypothetical protein
MSSIIAKPLRRQSHRWHSSFAVARWRSEPLRSNLSDYRRSCGPEPRPSVAAVSTLFIGNCAGKLHLQRRATIPGNSKQ